MSVIGVRFHNADSVIRKAMMKLGHAATDQLMAHGRSGDSIQLLHDDGSVEDVHIKDHVHDASKGTHTINLAPGKLP